MMNILNGGKHADNNVDFQEFMIQPWGFDSFSEGLRAGVEIYHSLKKVLSKNKMSTAVGDEGGFAPDLKDNEDALKVIGEAVTAAGYEFGKQVFVALDPAASELWDNEKKGYKFFKSNPDKIVSSEQMVDYWAKWVEKYPIRSLEDGLAENDWDGWKKLTERLGDKIQLVGDDLFVTNVKFLEKGIKTGTANSILVKVNQIGTLSETFATVNLAIRNGYSAVLSHRSGETEDPPLPISPWRPTAARSRPAPGPQRSRRQVQPAPAHRGATRRPRRIRLHLLEQITMSDPASDIAASSETPETPETHVPWDSIGATDEVVETGAELDSTEDIESPLTPWADAAPPRILRARMEIPTRRRTSPRRMTRMNPKWLLSGLLARASSPPNLRARRGLDDFCPVRGHRPDRVLRADPTGRRQSTACLRTRDAAARHAKHYAADPGQPGVPEEGLR